MADALIAVIAAENRRPICTGSSKHYRAVEEIDIEAFTCSDARA
jgi:hypothetical protein